MTYVIIFVAIALALSPVLWMMPSPKQKRQMQLRQRAMALGLQVKVCDLPQSYRDRVRQESPEQGVVYRLLWRRPDTDNENFHYLCLRAGDNGDAGSAVEEVLSSALDAMDDTIVAVDYTASGIAVYWRENGPIEKVDQIFQQLQQLKKALLVTSLPAA